jgi:hypothetical protein
MGSDKINEDKIDPRLAKLAELLDKGKEWNYGSTF